MKKKELKAWLDGELRAFAERVRPSNVLHVQIDRQIAKGEPIFTLLSPAALMPGDSVTVDLKPVFTPQAAVIAGLV